MNFDFLHRKIVFNKKWLKIVAIAVGGLSLLAVLGYSGYIYFQNIKLTTKVSQVESSLQTKDKELADLKSQDQVKINANLQKQIDKSRLLLPSPMTVYEKLLDLENPPRISKVWTVYTLMFCHNSQKGIIMAQQEA